MAGEPYVFAHPAIGTWPCCHQVAARYDAPSKQAAENGVCLDNHVFSTPMAMAGLNAYKPDEYLKAGPFSIFAGPSRIGDFDVNRLKRLSLVLLAATMLPSGAALARVDQPAQDAASGSGPVIHLFGAQSVFNKIGNVVPNQPQAAPAPAANAAVAPTAANAAPVAASSATETPASNGSEGLLHQMFVTGDNTPANARLSQGRPGAR